MAGASIRTVSSDISGSAHLLLCGRRSKSQGTTYACTVDLRAEVRYKCQTPALTAGAKPTLPYCAVHSLVPPDLAAEVVRLFPFWGTNAGNSSRVQKRQ